VHAVRALARSSGVEAVVVAAPANDVAAVQRLLGRQVLGTDVWVVPGGDTRQRSVAAALTALPAHIDTVLVHDAARPLVPVELVTRVVAALRDGAAAAIPVLPVPDTLKEIESVGASGRVVRTVDRTRLRAVQTPQGFRRDVLTQAHEAALVDGVETTDDAGLVELIGVEVVVVPGAEDAFKVTRPLDLVLAEAVLAGRRAARSSQL
jgi:2-C-methyl-D-erythritol 4-phosphate cytidylyltransferase